MWRLRHLQCWQHQRQTIRSSLLQTSLPASALTSSSLPSRNPSSPPPSLQRSSQIITRHFAGRKDRASTAYETRKPTKKQRKAYHKRQREQQYEATKHSKPGSKAIARRLEDRENKERLLEIAKEEEQLKQQLGVYFDRVNDIQSKIESSEKFTTLVKEGKVPQHEIKLAAREAAKKSAEKQGVSHPPLPSWWQERLTYDWGDALIDDLMGNSSDLTSSPSPYPIYMGGEYGRLQRKVERAIRGVQDHERFLLEEGNNNNMLPAARINGHHHHQNVLSDKLISDFIRSYRDAHGKRTTPIGLVPTLELLLRESQIPRSSLGTYSYVSLLTCCKSPLEARKVNEMRKEDGVRSNAYFWSALVDVYARSGDYRGAEIVLDEMLEETKMEYETWEGASRIDQQKMEKPIAIPPLPAYTSFFSACYKLISRVDVHPSIKADASKRAWARWKEMRIHSVAPDVMAYGALMRIFAAQGRPEKALELLEEIMMQLSMPVSAESVMNANGEVLKSMDGDEDGWYDDREGKTVRVKPTTLLFTSALKAVAKSHEIASRFSGGKSKKHRKRESITSYHGRLARKIVILAEQAEVEQDDGFVSALMLCAATAGDSSTCRAIYLGSKVRRMDHLRTCGGKDHLKRLQGLVPENAEQKLIGTNSSLPSKTGQANNSPAVRSIEEEFMENHKAYEHREYGTDTRILTSLLLAHAKAMEPKGLGSIWAGSFNRGYLCENSLRWIEAYNIPQKANMAIPGVSSVDAGLTPEGWEAESFEDDDRNSKQLRKKHKFNIKKIMDDGYGNRRDEMDSFFNFDPNPEEVVRNDDTDNEVSRDWLIGDNITDNIADELLGISSDNEDGDDDEEDGITTLEYRPSERSSLDNVDDNYFDDDSDSEDEMESDDDDDVSNEQDALIQALTSTRSTDETKLAKDLGAAIDDKEDGDFDPDDYFDEEEFNKLLDDTMRGMDDSKGGDAEELKQIPGVASNDFAAFKRHIQEELAAEGSSHDVSEEESRQLFDMMRTYFEDKNDNSSPAFEPYDNSFPSESQPIPEAKRSWETKTMSKETIYADDYIEWANSQDEQTQRLGSAAQQSKNISIIDQSNTVVDTTGKQQMLPSQLEQDNFHISELQQALPGMPMSRLEKISEEFERVLSYPSILRLSVAVRENMPDAFSPQCLVRKNLADAKFVFSQAASEGLVDSHLLNGMLQVQTNAGRIEPALRFYETEYAKNGVVRTTHSDRLVIEMLVKKKRLSRAFKLKQDIENEGRNLDLLSYGTLVDHYGKKGELGSALMLIQECVDIHGSPPGEKSLKSVRDMCQKRNLTKQVRLEQMVGKDPLEWIKKGEPLAKGKRRGSNLMYGMNRLVDI